MKKRVFSLIALASIFLLLTGVSKGETMDRKLTLMIYMCGSNLESGYGTASADIEEMKAAGLKGKDVTVLLMTGGTEQWSQGYDATKCLIHELGPRGTRVVWRSDAMNMGEPETLTQLLRFGREAYPAEDYALILWNHGGGPVEGVCWDELFSLDRLTLAELSSAIEKADMGKKLRWVGFDACLMGSVEVASALAPYAEYMIASQETEPAKGWNYAFLKDLGQDESGAQTGIRIVDAYFEGNAGTNDTHTLSCIDLSRVGSLEEAMSVFFKSLGDTLDPLRFNRISAIRTQTTSFGRSVNESSDDDYDLVDLGDLTLRLEEQTDGGGQLHDAIESAVVYARSNISAFHGISVYHPLLNKEKYLSVWKERYAALLFCPGYTEYMNRFSDVLTGDQLTSWTDLAAEEPTAGENRDVLFSLQLTEEQAVHFSSAQLLILMAGTMNDMDLNSYMLVSACPAAMDENGLITAAYHGRTLYAVTEQGQWIGPLSYTVKQGIEGNTVAALYTPSGKEINIYKNVLAAYQISDETDTGSGVPDILQIRVFDDATEYYTNRIAFSEEGMDTVYFWDLDKKMPDPGEDGVLPDYFTWENETRAVSAKILHLPNDWHFEYSQELLTSNALYAVFRVTDTQQNTYCSQPVPVKNLNLREIALKEGAVETDEYRVEASVQLNRSALDSGLELRFQVTNLTDVEAEYRFNNVKLNDVRAVSAAWGNASSRIPPHETRVFTASVSAPQLLYMDALHAISADLILYRDASSYDRADIPLRFETQSADSISGIAPSFDVLAEAEQENALIQLLRLSGGNNRIYATLYIQNQRDTALELDDVLCNGIEIDHNMIYKTIEAQTDAVLTIEFYDCLWTDSMEVSVPGAEDYHNLLLDRQILRQEGQEEITQLELIADSDKKQKSMEVFSLPLKQPWPVQESISLQISMYFDTYDVSPQAGREGKQESVLYEQKGQYAIALKSVFLGEQGALFCLKLQNQSDVPILIEFDSFTLGNRKASKYLTSSTVFLVPHSTRFTVIAAGKEEDAFPEGMAFDKIGFSAYGKGQSTQSIVTISLSERAQLGVPGGVTLTPKDWSLQTVKNTANTVPEATPEPRAPGEVKPYETSVSVPDNAKQYSAWIDAPLSEEELKEISRGWLTVVKKIDDDYYRLVTHQSLQMNDEGRLGVTFPGLVLCLADAPDLVVFSYPTAEETSIEYRMQKNGIVFWCTLNHDNPDVSSNVNTTSLTVIADADANSASLSYEIDGELGQFQEDLSTTRLMTSEIFYEPDENGEYPSIPTLSFYRGFDWYLSVPEFSLEGQPLRLALRPIAPEDAFQFVFSFERKDGSSYSIPPIPYRQSAQALNLPSEIYMPSNFSLTPPLTILPADAAADLFWTTDNENVAYVNEEGMLVTKETGAAHLTVTDRSSGLSSTAAVYSCGPVTNIVFAEESVVLEAGATYSVTAYVTIGDHECVNQFVSFFSSDEQLVTIDETGAVTPLREGEAVITAAAENGVRSTCTITVKARENGHSDTNKDEKPKYAQILSIQPNGYCYLYDQPNDIDGVNLGRYDNGETVEILEDEPVHGYYLVKCPDDKVGYVHSNALSISYPDASLFYWVCSTDPMGYCYLYDQPNDIDGNNLGRYDDGEKIEIIDWWADDTYALVRCVSTQKVGYMRKTCLTDSK